MPRKKKTIVAKQNFTFKGKLYKIGDEFKGKKSEVTYLTNKNLLKDGSY